jgi:ankyrin repeat protein
MKPTRSRLPWFRRFSPFSLLALLLLGVASCIATKVYLVDLERSDVSNLELALSAAFHMLVAIVIWWSALAFASVGAIIETIRWRAPLAGAIAITGCLVGYAVLNSYVDRPTPTRLVHAVRQSDVAEVMRCLDHGVDVNVPGMVRLGFGGGESIGDTPLAAAARSGNMSMAKFLLTQGAVINGDRGQRAPLACAINSLHPDMAEWLLKRGAVMKPGGREHLQLALRNARFGFPPRGDEQGQLIDLLVQHGASVDSFEVHRDAIRIPDPRYSKQLATLHRDHATREPDSATELLISMASGDNKRTLRLLDEHPEFVDRFLPLEGQRVLAWASRYGLRDVVEELTTRGVNVNPTANAQFGLTPLHEAARQGHTDIVRYLLDNSADLSVDVPGYGTPLHCAVSIGDGDLVRLFISRGADVNGPTGGRTPLFVAAETGNLELAELLVEHGCDLDRVVQHSTALDVAIHQGHADVADLLREQSPKR